MERRLTQRDAVSDYDRIAATIRFLDEHRTPQPRLRDVADAAGLSEFHFQRLFTRWAGISPKRFAQLLTIDGARALLRQSRSLLDAALELGLSGPSRLHDLFVTIDAVTPGEYKGGGGGLRIKFGMHESPFGSCLIGVTGRGICWLSFADGHAARDGLTELRETWPAAELVRNPRATAAIAGRVFRVRRTERGAPLRLLVGGTNFQLKVWEALIGIPPGRVATYGELAKAIGQPHAARAVGHALAANPISYLIPCHRVIRGLGVVGNYRWGTPRKQAMLAWEGAQSASGGAWAVGAGVGESGA